MMNALVRPCIALLAAAGVVYAASGGVWKPAAPTASPLPAAAPAPASMKEIDCVKGFSKDICDGYMYPGHVTGQSCQTHTDECKSLTITGATFYSPLKLNTATCSDDALCDEAPQLDEIKVAVNYMVRLNKPCPFRGCWEGEGEVRHGGGGETYQGTLMGTFGVGTHRDFLCPEYRTCTCEKCYDVEFFPDQNLWRIGFEASFHGKRSDEATGEEVCLSLSGDWYLKGGPGGPDDWSGNFKIKGTVDGVWETFCH